MTTNMKDRWITISLAIVCSFGSVVFANKLSGRMAKENNYEQRIRSVEETKADKQEVKELRQENILMHQNDKNDMKAYFDTRFEDLKEFMIELNKRK